MISTAIQKFGKLDILVNNAGGQFPSPAENISLKGNYWRLVKVAVLLGISVFLFF